MARKTYLYNPETCNYEPYRPGRIVTFLKIFGFLLLAFCIALATLYLTKEKLGTIKEAHRMVEREEIKLRLELMEQRLENFYSKLNNIIKKDDEVYRVILEGVPIPKAIRGAGAGGAEPFKSLTDNNVVYSNKLLNNYLKLNKIKRQIYVQSLSFDELQMLAWERDKMWASIPSIQPIYNKDLRRLSTIFGMRFHPMLKQWRPHKGLDFMAPKGTPVYATGDGIVKYIRYSETYGKVIDVDHGYGYITRYAHLNKFNVKEGEKVVRGQCIGYVGNTGLSVSDHLHYEVLKDAVQINPIGFFQRELDDKAYHYLLELAQRETTPLD